MKEKPQGTDSLPGRSLEKRKAQEAVANEVKQVYERIAVPKTFEVHGRRYSVADEIDFLVATEQSKAVMLEEGLTEGGNGYYDYIRESALRKTIELCRVKALLWMRLGELIRDFPDLAQSVIAGEPELLRRLTEAREQWKRDTDA